MKQTAVKWLIDQLVNENEVVLKGENYKLFEQALAMEKEQIIDAYYQCGKDNFEHIKVINKSAIEYYNETYGTVR